MKFLVYGYFVYAIVYFVVWIHHVFNSKILTGSVGWILIIIITNIYENGKYSNKNLFVLTKEALDIFLGFVFVNLLMIFSPMVVFGRELLLVKNKYVVNKKIIKKVVAIIFLLAVFIGYAYIINISMSWVLLSVMTLNLSLMIFVITGVVIFIYMLMGMPFVARWFTRWENDSVLVKYISKVVVALHIFLIFPLVWLTE